MVVLRRTRKLAAALPGTVVESDKSDTALGDWYVNRLVVDRRPLLLFISQKSLLPILTPARNVSALRETFPDIVTRRLRRLGIESVAIERERAAMATVNIGPTIDRSVVGIMVDFAKVIPLYFETASWDDSALPFVEAKLAETPCHAGKRDSQVIWPAKAAIALLLSPRRAG